MHHVVATHYDPFDDYMNHFIYYVLLCPHISHQILIKVFQHLTSWQREKIWGEFLGNEKMKAVEYLLH